MLKCCSDRWVCGPHNLSAETSTAPRLSNSVRASVILLSILLGNQVWTTACPSQPVATPDSTRAYRERANANIAELAARETGFSIRPRSQGEIAGAGS